MKHLTLVFVLLCIFACSSEDIVSTVEESVEPANEVAAQTVNLLDSLEIMDYIYSIIDSGPKTRISLHPQLPDGWDSKLTPEQRKLFANTYPRPLFTTEKKLLNENFPRLDYSNAVVYGPSTTNYNCFAYSMGLNHRWIEFRTWMECDDGYRYAMSKFGSAYNYYDYYDGTFAHMAVAWGLATPLHAVSKSEWQNPCSYSKMGRMWLLWHTDEALTNNGIYGFPTKRYFPAKTRTRATEEISEASQENITFSQDELAFIYKKSGVSKEKTRFESLFNEWKEAWNWSLSNNTASTRQLPQYADLKAMGKDIIPLLIEKMVAEEDNFFAIRLYEDLQDNPDLIIRYAPDDPCVLEGLQQTTKKTIKKWLEYNSN